jgi:hypothetical protein
MLSERSDVTAALVDAGRRAGFRVASKKPAHSGEKHLLYYQGKFGPDHVKVDLNFLNRATLLPPLVKTITVPNVGEVSFPIKSDPELFGGKTQALVERPALRDLYDISSIRRHLALHPPQDPILYRRVMLYNVSLSGPFPHGLEIGDRFEKARKDMDYVLYAVLCNDDRPTFDNLVEGAELHLSEISSPIDDYEFEYMRRAAQADFAPELLFADYPCVLTAAQNDPVAEWKFLNMAKMLGLNQPATVINLGDGLPDAGMVGDGPTIVEEHFRRTPSGGITKVRRHPRRT